MAQAMKCDRCGVLYETPRDDAMPFNIVEGVSTDKLDLCNECKYDLEDWMQNPKRFPKVKGKRQKRTVQHTKEHLENMSDRMSIAQELAAEFIENEGIERKAALSKAHQQIKEKGLDYYRKNRSKTDKRNFKDIPKNNEGKSFKSAERKQSYRCTMCGNGKFDKPHQMCEECEKMFSKNKDPSIDDS